MEPLTFKISTIHCYKVQNILFDKVGKKTSNDLSTTLIRSSMILGHSLLGKDRIALTQPRSKIFRSGEFGG